MTGLMKKLLPGWTFFRSGGRRAGAGRPKGSRSSPKEIKPLTPVGTTLPQRKRQLTKAQGPVLAIPEDKLLAIKAGGRGAQIRRFVSDRSARNSVQFLERVRDGVQEFEDVRVGKDGQIVRFKREPPAELRLKAAEWLAGRRIPQASPRLKDMAGAKVLTVIIHPNEPEI